MASGELSVGPVTLCRVGDTLEVTCSHPQIGTWSYTARILWIRGGHLGLTPPEGRWQQAIQKDGRLALAIQHRQVTARLPVRVVGITTELPPVLVVRQESAETPLWQDGSIAVERRPPLRPGFRPLV